MADIYKSKYTGEQIEQMLENASAVARIVPNPDAEGTTPLTKITIGDVVYIIPEGETVTPNPDTDATETLSKLQIGDVVYSVEGGGGGGNIYRYQLDVTISGTSRTFYFESPYILESVDDILNNYRVTTGKSSIAVHGNSGAFSDDNCVFLGYIQVTNDQVYFFYFNIQRVNINNTYYFSTSWGGVTNINVYSPIITRLT